MPPAVSDHLWTQPSSRVPLASEPVLGPISPKETPQIQKPKNQKIRKKRFGPTDMSSCQNTQFDMQNSILRSKIANSFNQRRKHRKQK